MSCTIKYLFCFGCQFMQKILCHERLICIFINWQKWIWTCDVGSEFDLLLMSVWTCICQQNLIVALHESHVFAVAECLQILRYQYPSSNMLHSRVSLFNTLLFGFVDIVSLSAFQVNFPNKPAVIDNKKNNHRISWIFM